MRKLYFCIFAASAVTACTAPDDYAGEIVDFNGSMVTIEGVMNQPDGMEVKPTPAMQASAEDACQGAARFTGWDDNRQTTYNPHTSLADSMMVTYRFLCR